MSLRHRSRLHGPNNAHKFRPVPFRDDDEVSPIGNAPPIEAPDDDFPDEFKLEIYRLRRRVADLESTVRDKNDRIVRAIKTLDDELAMWRQVLHDDVKETYDGVRRRIIRLEGTVARLKDKGSLYSPPLEIPDKWKKKN